MRGHQSSIVVLIENTLYVDGLYLYNTKKTDLLHSPHPPFPHLLQCPPSAGGNAKLRYQITSGNTGGVFDVEPEVGTIFIAQALDYEQNKR